jgi:uncharacterized protein YjbJ (UPF0337 family)
MTDDRIAGTVRNVGGKVQEAVGKVSGNAKTEAEGVLTQAAGAVQNAYGQAQEAAAGGAETIKQAAIESHDYLKKFVEDNPHTATMIAIFIGFLIGYAVHQPPPRRGYWWD